MNADELIKEYGKYRLVAFWKDTTDGWNNRDGLVDFAGQIHSCYITTLGEFLRWDNPDCHLAGYRMTREYDSDTAEEENGYLEREAAINEEWVMNSVYGEDRFHDDEFTILDDSWSLSKDKLEDILRHLQYEYEYVGFMKPCRAGNWDDNFTREERKQRIIWAFLLMSARNGDWTGNGQIPDEFSYDEERGWYGLNGMKRYRKVNELFNTHYEEIV